MQGYVPQARMTIEEQSYAVKYLQCLLPSISKILFGARYAQIFVLSERREWQDTKLAGALYIAERKDEPKYCLMVPSKQTLDTLLLPIVENLKLDIKVDDSLKVHAIYFKAEEDGKIYCINFETAELAKEAFGILEELKVKEGRRKYPKELKKGLADALKALAQDEEFVELLAEKVGSVNTKVINEPKTD